MYLFLCNSCKKDKELFFLGYFSTNKDAYSTSKSVGCGCSRGHRWTQKELEVKVKRQCDKFNYKFLRVDTSERDHHWKLSDKLTLICPKHGEWSSCSMRNFLKDRTCPSCAKESRKEKRIIDKTDIIKSLAEDCSYKIITTLKPKIKNRDKIDLICNKNHTFSISVENFRYGRRCPICKGKNMDILYIHRVEGFNGETLIKVGITKDLDHRISTQNLRNKVRFSFWRSWKFKSVDECKKCELQLKKYLQKPEDKSLIKENFKDGHSEIFIFKFEFTPEIIENIIDKYQTCAYIPDKELNKHIHHIFKDNIVK